MAEGGVTYAPNRWLPPLDIGNWRHLRYSHRRRAVPEVGNMKILFWAGVVILALGIASLFVPIPQTHNTSIGSGEFKVGVQTRDEEKIPPIAAAALILGGAGIMAAGASSLRRQ